MVFVAKTRFGVWSILTVKCMKRVAQKLCRMILLHLGLILFRFHCGKSPKPHHFHDFQIFGRVHDCQNQLILLEDTQNTSKNERKYQMCSTTSILGDLKILSIQKIIVGKDEAGKS